MAPEMANEAMEIVTSAVDKFNSAKNYEVKELISPSNLFHFW